MSVDTLLATSQLSTLDLHGESPIARVDSVCRHVARYLVAQHTRLTRRTPLRELGTTFILDPAFMNDADRHTISQVKSALPRYAPPRPTHASGRAAYVAY